MRFGYTYYTTNKRSNRRRHCLHPLLGRHHWYTLQNSSERGRIRIFDSTRYICIKLWRFRRSLIRSFRTTACEWCCWAACACRMRGLILCAVAYILRKWTMGFNAPPRGFLPLVTLKSRTVWLFLRLVPYVPCVRKTVSPPEKHPNTLTPKSASANATATVTDDYLSRRSSTTAAETVVPRVTESRRSSGANGKCEKRAATQIHAHLYTTLHRNSMVVWPTCVWPRESINYTPARRPWK